MIGGLTERPRDMTRDMTEPTLSRDVVSRVLQVTLTSWAQTLALPPVAQMPPSAKLSSHRITVQQMALNRRMPWGLQIGTRLPQHPQA